MKVLDTIFSYPVRDLAKMTDFYRDVLGFVVEDTGADGWTLLRSTHARIAIHPNPRATPINTHLMIVVENLEEAIVDLRLARVEIEDVYTHLKLAKFRDPEGNAMAVHELPPGSEV